MTVARYRTDYQGEFVVLETRWAGGKKRQTREWIPNPIENHHLSGRAACIGSSIDREIFNYQVLQRHRGGLLGSKKLQTYGVASIALEMRLDFAISNNFDQIKPLMENQYYKDNIIYTTPRICILNPGSFYLIPYAPVVCADALPLYLAAFDGHSEVFALGYHNETPSGNSGWITQIKDIVSAYSTTRFNFVGEKTIMPDTWFDCENVNSMTYRDFISYCDV
jgi:hypothetical protein